MPLTTTLDGTQTFGLDARTAWVASPGPTITSPPYTELEFPLYLKPRSTAFPDVIRAVMASLRQPDTPLNTAFFSRANVDLLQEAIRWRIEEGLGLAIDRQSDWELLLIMRRTYLGSANNWPEDVAREVDRLNSQVAQIAVDAISRNITNYMVYQSRIPMPVAFGNPADMLVSPPFETGTPAPLVDLNADYDTEVRGFRSTPLPDPTGAPRFSDLPFPTLAPGASSNLNASFDDDWQRFMATPLPDVVRTPRPNNTG